MDPKKFDVVAQLIRRRSGRVPSIDGARLVLVGGMTQVEAAEQCGSTQSSVSASVRRIRKAYEQIESVWGARP